MSTVYLQCEPKDIAKNVIMVGDPGRVKLAGEYMDSAEMISQNREFTVLTGAFRGTKISLVSSGIGSPSLGIALEELAHLGAKSVLRAGTAMSITTELGSYVVSTGAIRGEGTSKEYLPVEFPAVPDLRLSHTILERLRQSGVEHNYGITATFDSFYSDMAPVWIDKNRKLDDTYQVAKENGVLAMDMESSFLFVLSTYLNLNSASLCLVTNMPEAPEDKLEGEERNEAESMLIRLSLETLSNYEGG